MQEQKDKTAERESSEKLTLASFGYEFKDGKMVDSEGNRFKFEVSSDRAVNQRRYEAIGSLVTEAVYKMLEDDCELERAYVPSDLFEKGERDLSFVFHSKGIFDADKIAIFFNGAGVVRAGQWTRKLIMNNSIEEGTMIPFIKKVQSLGYSVLCMNTNERGVESESGFRHGCTVWKDIVQKSKATRIIIVAHSAGGDVTVDVAERFKEDFKNKVKGIFFSDSVHGGLTGDEELDAHLQAIGKDYVGSSLPGDTPIASRGNLGFRDGKLVKMKYQIPKFSSGHTDHIWTSFSAMPYIFRDIDNLEEGDI